MSPRQRVRGAAINRFDPELFGPRWRAGNDR